MTLYNGKRDAIKPGILYVVATPIGNLEDITLRALRVLKEVDMIAAEDTRKTLKLLNHYGIRKRLVSLYGDVEKGRAPQIVKEIENGTQAAVVSEAGTPGASDPGGILVRMALESGVRVVPVPGASAVSSAVSAAGINTSRFVFEGFLPRKVSKKLERLAKLKNDDRAIILFESPNRIHDTLKEMFNEMGDRKVVIFRELTKIHEKIECTTLKAAACGEILLPQKGEYTIIVEGLTKKDKGVEDDDKVHRYIKVFLARGYSVREAAEVISLLLDLPKNKIYRKALLIKNLNN
ncbi:MAG: 16S rRNA (cytidine(1402)-2'-O)-methyltransferase [bacterium]